MNDHAWQPARRVIAMSSTESRLNSSGSELHAAYCKTAVIAVVGWVHVLALRCNTNATHQLSTGSISANIIDHLIISAIAI